MFWNFSSSVRTILCRHIEDCQEFQLDCGDELAGCTVQTGLARRKSGTLKVRGLGVRG